MTAESSGIKIDRPVRSHRRLQTLGALAVVYAVWGSTYLAIRIALRIYPPFLIGGLRFFVAGVILMLALQASGASLPTARQWRHGALIGVLLVVGGNAPIIYAEQTVGSALAALVIASVPLWLVLMSWLWGQRPTAREGFGLAVGLVGVVLLSLQGDLRASPVGLGCLMLANGCWALGSIWGLRLDLPKGFMSSAVEMIAGGAVLLGASASVHERWLPGSLLQRGGLLSTLAVGYLAIFGSLLAFSAYTDVLRHTRPAVASSYAYVTPLVALALGVGVAGERVSWLVALAVPTMLAGVVIILTRSDRNKE